MSFEQFMKRQLCLIKYCHDRYGMPPEVWIAKYSAKYRAKIIKRFGAIVHPS